VNGRFKIDGFELIIGLLGCGCIVSFLAVESHMKMAERAMAP